MRNRNNKGFTLVEFLVAMAVFAVIMTEVVTLMANCSNLYKNGNAEITLQGEAQRVTQIIEELVVDTVSIPTVTPSTLVTGSDVIVVETTNATTGAVEKHTIEIKDWNSTRKYGNLYLDGQLLAENCRSINMDVSPVTSKENDTATLSIEMATAVYGNIGEYTYGQDTKKITKDFFMRNRPGTGDTAEPTTASDNNIEVEVLRYETLDLEEVFKDQKKQFGITSSLSYVWSNGTQDSKNGFYHLDGSTLKTNAINKQFNYDKDKSKDTLKVSYAGTELFEATIYSVPVEVGMSVSNGSATSRTGYGIFWGFQDTATTDQDSVIVVKGISLDKKAIGLTDSWADDTGSVKATLFIPNPGSITGLADFDPSSISSKIKDSKTLTLNDTASKSISIKDLTPSKIESRIDGVKVRIDPTKGVNAFVIHTGLFHADGGNMTSWNEFFTGNKYDKVYASFEVTYPDTTTINLYTYLAPCGNISEGSYSGVALPSDFHIWPY